MISNLRGKYGSKILKDIGDVNFKQYWGLTQVAKKYNLSRERVRQYYRMIFGQGYRKAQKEKTKKLNRDISCVHDPRRKVADFKPGTTAYRAAIVEKAFLCECEKIGLMVNIPCNGEVDIEINNHRVDVKSCSRAKRYHQGAQTRYFRYVCKGNQVKTADFFACYHPGEKAFFIIPRKKTNKVAKNGEISIYIRNNRSYHKLSKNRYWEYKNAWHLLMSKKIKKVLDKQKNKI
jgi:hypothetical protein